VTTINTGYGALDVPDGLLQTWNQYGWPEESALKRMTEQGSVGPSSATPQAP
jgi:hypothetical protein